MKKFNAFILCLLLLITCGFAGCAGFSVNRVKYYNETVATVGNTHIARYELLSAYNSYGRNYYVSQLGKTEKEAFAETLNLLMDQASLYQYAQQHSEFKPSAYQVNNAIAELYKSMDSTMSDYVKKAKRILNITITENSSSDNSETAYKYSDYNTELAGKRAELKTKIVDGESVDYISYIIKEDPSFACILGESNLSALSDFSSSETIQLIIDTYFEKFNDSLSNEDKQAEIYNKSISLLAQDLISSEKYLRDSKGNAYNTATKDLLNRYFTKTYNDKIKSLYLTNVRTEYLKNATDELSINALIEKYVSLVETSYNKYANFEKSYKSAMKDAGTKADEILYHPDLSDNTKFGYFIHTLIKFSDGSVDANDNQKSDIKNLEAIKSTLSDEAYRTAYDAIIARTTATERDATTGLIADDAKEYTLNEVLAEYNNVSSLDEFIQFMFRFTEDTATLTQGMPYVVGTNNNSAMETAFTDEAVRLMTDGNPGDMTPATTNTNSKNGVTMCITSYGIHFLYYIGEVNMFDVPFNQINSAYIATSNKTGNDYNLYKMELNPLTHKTYFDMLFDAVYPASSESETYASSTGYTVKENEIIQEMRKTNPAKINQTKLDATKSSL